MQESVEAVGEFVVACREATKLFEPVEESLNQIARFVPLRSNSRGLSGLLRGGMAASAPVSVIVATNPSLSYPLSATTPTRRV
jgi:hypothetical protein